MTTPIVTPPTLTIPFANGAGAGYITETIPVPSQISITPGAASYTDGFPPVTMSDPLINGIPPSGQDFNGIFNVLSAHNVWLNAGGLYKFNSTISDSAGGYAVGAVLQDNAGLNAYVNILEGNVTDFNSTPASIGVSWLPWAGNCVAPVSGGEIVFNATITLPSSSTVAIGAAASNNIIISGSTTITAFDTVTEGRWKLVHYTGAVPITYNGTSMQLIGGVSRTMASGDCSWWKSLGSGNWKEVNYIPFAGYVTPLFLTNTLASYAKLSSNNVYTGTNTFAAVRETYIAIPSSNLDLSLGNYYSKTITGNTTLTLTNIPASGIGQTFVLQLTNGGAYTTTLWSGIKWQGGTPPTLTASGRDDITFFTRDGGTTWDGSLLAQAIS